LARIWPPSRTLAPSAARGLLVAAAALAGAPLADRASAAACRDHEYAVYLSPGYEKGVRWGGYHATLTGFSANHVCSGSMTSALQKAWRKAQDGKPYSFRSKVYKKDYQERLLQHPWGQKWGVSFNSSMLTRKLMPMLRKAGFEKLKSHWHISLYADNAKTAVSSFEHHLKNKPWKLWLVRLPDKSCQDAGKACPEDGWAEIR